jgi:deoxycytidylate deaminase
MSKINRIINQIDTNNNYGDMKFKHVSGLIVKGKLVSIGNNHFRNIVNNNIVPSIHAEIHALMKYLGSNNLNEYSVKKLKKSEIVVIRISNDPNINHYLESRPCSECIKMLKRLNIKNVYYSNSDGKIVKECVKCMEATYVTHGNYNLLGKKKI